ncbi:Hypothetical predicted protein [Cloeon dipterum]|uniref:F-box domain-containing protein n=1 Tax=Cloeon dipterum TaxID=197152 RepID=A0A8S1E553_9INSE|nr:Hypothetical predicted protein [Cloeon dipterum]
MQEGENQEQTRRKRGELNFMCVAAKVESRGEQRTNARSLYADPRTHIFSHMKRSLENMAFYATMDNIDQWDKNYVKEYIGPLRRNKFSEIVYEATHHHLHCDGKGNHVDRLWAILPCLVSSLKYIQFDTSDLTEMRCKSSTLSNSRFQEFIRCLGSNTPNLKELKINSPYDLRHSLAERELASITQLQNLGSLLILNVCVPLSGFMELIRRCKKLESINVTDVEIDVEPSRVMFSKKFKFVLIDTLERLENNRLSLNLESSMPAFQNFEGVSRCMRLLLAPSSVAQISLVRGLKKVTENLFWFDALEDVEQMEEFPHFPEVKFAHLRCDGKSAHALRCYLKRNGQNLQKLRLEGIDAKENMTFAEIFSSCPNLESLKIYDSNLHGNNAPVEAMRRLKQFEWRDLYCEISDPVAFSSIMSAPLLEEVFIDLPNIDINDYNTVVNGIRSRKILRNLKKIEVVYQRLDANDALGCPIRVFMNSSGVWAQTHLI